MGPVDESSVASLDAAIVRLEEAVAATGAMGLRMRLHNLRHVRNVLVKASARESFRRADVNACMSCGVNLSLSGDYSLATMAANMRGRCGHPRCE